MQTFVKPYLQKYKGIATRHTCPQCERKQSFTLYLDGNTNQPINSKVGICNRESKCGYHYPPKQFFLDNPDLQKSYDYNNTSNTTNVDSRSTPLSSRRGVGGEVVGVGFGSIPFTYVQNSASYKSNFVRFLCEILTNEQIHSIGENYALGATKTAEVIFWQIDFNGKVRTGKIMQYNPITGRRLKHESGAIDWVHNKLKKTNHLPEDFNLQQCFFGEHLLKLYPDKTVAIVESEKSALIASAIFPDLVWLGAGNMNGLSIEKCQVLQKRNVILFPDLNAYDKWSEKAIQIEKDCKCKISVSTILEDIATPAAKEKGLDIADYMINQLQSPLSSNSQKVEFLSQKTNKVQFPSPFGEGVQRTGEVGESPQRGIEVRGVGGEPIQPPVIQNPFTPELVEMIETNPALLTLINKLDLIEF